jgi:hypothetical protein
MTLARVQVAACKYRLMTCAVHIRTCATGVSHPNMHMHMHMHKPHSTGIRMTHSLPAVACEMTD